MASNLSPYALYQNRMFTGIWTNRSPLRDAATSFSQSKYGAGRLDSIWDGRNLEITSKLTLRRRPGTTVYNSQSFPTPWGFYDFKTFSTTSEDILMMVDTATAVYDGTGPDRQVNIWNKSPGAGKTTFLGLGNTLYMGNGVDQTKWVQSTIAWSPSTARAAGDYIVDPNGNVQTVADAISEGVVSGSISGNVIYFNLHGINPFPPGTTFTPTGLTLLAPANNVPLVAIQTNYSNTVAAHFIHADIAQGGDTGTVSTPAPTSTGVTEPQPWGPNPGDGTIDGGVLWINKGAASQPWGLAGPTTAPTATTAGLPSIYPQWQPNTIYSSSLVIVDEASNIQLLVQGGVTGGAEPAFEAFGFETTQDGSAVWSNRGSSRWFAGLTYKVGDLVAISFTYYIPVYGVSPSGQLTTTYVPTNVNVAFVCARTGVAGLQNPTWVDGVGSSVQDGTVVWVNTGTAATWATAVGPNASVSVSQTILDSNGNIQTIQTSGKSGGSAPDWQTSQGATTNDGAAAWKTGLPFAAAATSPQQYAYAWGNSVTNEKSNASPLSTPITLPAASLIIVQGATSSKPTDDTVYLYRTLKGGSTYFLLDEFPMRRDGVPWTYFDTSSDADLVIEIQAPIALQLTPPPVGAIGPTYHLQRVWVSVQNVLYWSLGPDAILFAASGNSGFPAANNFVLPSRVVRTWACTLGLLVWTVSDIFIVQGTGTSGDPFYVTPYLYGVGLRNFNCFCVQGSTPYFIDNSLRVVSLDPSAGVLEVGFPVADKIASEYGGNDTFLAYHSESSADSGMYAGDGVKGWLRWSPSSAPETGSCWSPAAVIGGGCSVAASVEVSPGNRRLLIGQTFGGPILQRDSTVNTDMGEPFPRCDVTFGNIQLATPGQLAAMAFITLESVRVGSQPLLSVLLGEIDGTFEPILRTRQDPPNLEPSQSLWSDRYHLLQSGRPVYCRHFQMRIDFPAEDAANELLGFAVDGELMTEYLTE